MFRQSQQEFFTRCGVVPLLNSALDGYASTVFAYGQTGSGKTYSIAGSEATATPIDHSVGGGDSARPLQPTDGVVPRAIEHLFEEMERRKKALAERRSGDSGACLFVCVWCVCCVCLLARG